MNNIHNINNLNKTTLGNENSHLFLILAVAALLISGELLWSQVRNTNFEIDGYSANLSSAFPNRDVIEAAKLSAEASRVEVGDVEADFRSLDTVIESSL